jgi:hypothetical protein
MVRSLRERREEQAAMRNAGALEGESTVEAAVGQ